MAHDISGPSRRAELDRKIERARALREAQEARYRVRLGALEAEARSAQEELDLRRAQAALSREVAARHEAVYDHRFVSWAEHAKARMDAEQARVELADLEAQAGEARAALVRRARSRS